MKTFPTLRNASTKPVATLSGRRLVTMVSLIAVALAAAGCASDSGADPDTDATSGAAAAALSEIGKAGPKVGDCIADVDASTVVVDTTVPCDTRHTAEVVGVLTAPAGLDPENDADKERVGKLAAVECPDRRDYMGYVGDLTGVMYDGWVMSAANTATDTAGARWVACLVGFYDAGEPGSAFSSDLVIRDTSIKGAVTSDTEFLTYGTLCLNQPSPGDVTLCDPDRKRQYLALAVRTDRQPFESRAHQLETSRAFCAKVAPKYTGARDPQRWAFFSETAQEYYGQNCIIRLADFAGPQDQ